MATAAEIQRLRMISPDPVIDLYDESQLADLLDQHSGDVRSVAGLLWEQRAAQTSGFVDIREGSSARNMSQEHEHALRMAADYQGSTGRRGARVHKIVRE